MYRTRTISLTLIAMLLMQWHGTATSCADDSVSIKAALDKHNCVFGDDVILSITITGVEKPPEPQIPKIENVDVRSLGSSSQVYVSSSFVNGRAQNTAMQAVTFSYRLTPKGLGQYTVPEITFTTHKGEKLQTAPLTFACVKASDQDMVLLDVTADKTDMYQYEPVQVTLKLFLRDAKRLVQNRGYELDLGCLREIQGFIRAEPDDPDEKLKPIGEVTHKGKGYDVYSASRIFFPETAGERRLPAATMKCYYAKQFTPVRRGPFADPFLDDAFGSHLRTQDLQHVFARSNEVTINVRPLSQEGRPDGFSGAVGQFELNASLSRDKVRVGDPITLLTTITGTGYSGSITAPLLKSAEGFKVYEGDSKTEEKRSGNTVRVTKFFQTICEPQSTDVKAIPQVVFHYFDPRTAKYVTLAAGPLPITVSTPDRESPVRVTIQAAASPSGQLQVLKGDICPIVTSTTDLQDQGKLIYRDSRFLLSLVVPLFVAAFCALIQHRRERFRTDEAFARSKQAMRTARRHLAEAGTALSAGSPKEFYGILFKAVTEYVGDKTNSSAASVTSQALPNVLRSRNVDAELVAEAEACLRECEHGRFSAESKEGERDFLKKTTALLKKLERAIR